MRKIFLFFAICVCTDAFSAVQSVDNRSYVTDEQKTSDQYKPFVRLTSCNDNKTCESCTGQYVAKNLILSAAHCATPEKTYFEITTYDNKRTPVKLLAKGFEDEDYATQGYYKEPGDWAIFLVQNNKFYSDVFFDVSTGPNETNATVSVRNTGFGALRILTYDDIQSIKGILGQKKFSRNASIINEINEKFASSSPSKKPIDKDYRNLKTSTCKIVYGDCSVICKKDASKCEEICDNRKTLNSKSRNRSFPQIVGTTCFTFAGNSGGGFVSNISNKNTLYGVVSYGREAENLTEPTDYMASTTQFIETLKRLKQTYSATETVNSGSQESPKDTNEEKMFCGISNPCDAMKNSSLTDSQKIFCEQNGQLRIAHCENSTTLIEDTSLDGFYLKCASEPSGSDWAMIEKVSDDRYLFVNYKTIDKYNDIYIAPKTFREPNKFCWYPTCNNLCNTQQKYQMPEIVPMSRRDVTGLVGSQDDITLQGRDVDLTSAIIKSGSDGKSSLFAKMIENLKSHIFNKSKEIDDIVESVTEETDDEVIVAVLNDAIELDEDKERLEALQAAYDAAKEKEQSWANRTLTAATVAATGLGMMQAAQGRAEQKADAAAAADMAGYIQTMRCTYGDGKSVKASQNPIELPGGNDKAMMDLRDEYFALANKLKERKESLGMAPGIENEVILDKANMGLYDQENTGITSGQQSSLYRVQMLNSTADQDKINADKETSEKGVKYGGTVAGVGAVGGALGNSAINGKLGEVFKK